MIYRMNHTPSYSLPEFDQALIWSVLFLLGIGLVMVYSASAAIAEAQFGSDQSAHYLVRHVIYLLLGIVFGAAAFQVPVHIWQKYAIFLLLAGIILLVLVLLPGVGREVNGSQRWISLYVVNLQPSEMMKLFMIIYASDYVVRKAADLNCFYKGFLPLFALIVVMGFLLLQQPDFGAAAVITVLTIGILFLGGVSIKIFAGLLSLSAVAMFVLIYVANYRLERIIGFMDPWADPLGKGYQLSHALIAFGRGEWFGVGLGGSVEKLFYLPEAHTDFLLAVLAEELGFVGVAVVIVLFAILVTRAFAIGRQSARLECHFAALVAQGIGLWIGMQAIINMGVNMGVLPTKGLTLPLMSFGGSSITAVCFALAILMRIDWENRQRLRGVQRDDAWHSA
ncbi:cell division-specific peptidoglycan biosynthesis regulator FtsW [Nitrosomonas marina]|uniref:Probable peptidoglycan glycosyltransferase FtsW n=1 Tax=Nitrosomonas marina TaxID=917 RepID=A0A1H9ZKN5_9PROT|nr:putative lipid II flippase FtsW [Nitrosomonas marina]SES81360.1 cell division-specific peptidoglycan biosynthesis regulator FtsW [Nitrosomonas marina]